jgi:hypothetical protein
MWVLDFDRPRRRGFHRLRVASVGGTGVAAPSRGLSGEQRRALEILAGSPHGCTEGTLRAHGFTVRLLAGIVRSGHAVAKPEIVKAGGRTLSMLRLRISDAGRLALSG